MLYRLFNLNISTDLNINSFFNIEISSDKTFDVQVEQQPIFFKELQISSESKFDLFSTRKYTEIYKKNIGSFILKNGNKLLYEYAQTKKINHKKFGKYIIATSLSEEAKLKKIFNFETYYGYMIGLILLGIGWNFLFVTGTSLLVVSYNKEDKFLAQGLNDFVVFSCQSIGALSAGILLFATSWKILNLICLPLLILILLFLFVNNKSNKQ